MTERRRHSKQKKMILEPEDISITINEGEHTEPEPLVITDEEGHDESPMDPVEAVIEEERRRRNNHVHRAVFDQQLAELDVHQAVEELNRNMERGEFAHGGVASFGSGSNYHSPIQRMWSSRPESERRNTTESIRIRVEIESPYRPNSYNLHVFSRDEHTRRTSVVRDLVMETVEEGQMMPNIPGMRMNGDTIQELMNNLWILGIRPSDSINPDRQIATVLNQQIEHLRNIINQLLSNPAIRNNT
jgi:hypothetical protein